MRSLAASLAITATVAGCGLVASTTPVLDAAGWKSKPAASAPEPAFLDAAKRLCDPGTDEPPVIQDQRGPHGAAFAWATPAAVICLVGRTDGGSFWRDQRLVIASNSGILASTEQGGEPGSATLQAARVGPDVASVVLTVDDGTKVTAAVADGLEVAWWPGVRSSVAADVFDANGTLITRTE